MLVVESHACAGPAVDRQSVMRQWSTWVTIVGLALMCVAGATFAYCQFDASEKPGVVYILGHWCDLVWEVAAPAAVLGVVLLAVRLSHNQPLQRTGAERRGFEVLDVPERGTGR